MSGLVGLHPRFAKCSIVAIKFDRKIGTYVEMTGEHGEPLIVSARACLEGETLREILRLEGGPALTVVRGGLEDRLRASVDSAARLRGRR